jgi:tetratricopeptide (TPR) repeat protein
MRRILFYALLATMTFTPLLRADYPQDALANITDFVKRGQLPELIQTANSLLATSTLTPDDQHLVLIYLGYAYQQRGEFTKATAAYEKALAIVNRDGQHPGDYAATLATLATVYVQTGQLDTAKHVLLRSVHLFEDQTDHAGAAMVWNDLATIAAEQHSRGDAHKYMTRSIAESKLATNFTTSEFAALATTQGRIAELDGDPHTAISDYQHSLDLWSQSSQAQQPKTAWLYVLLGGVYLQAGDLANARDSTTRGLSMLEASSGRQTPRYFAAELAYSKVLDATGAHDQASALRKEAEANLNTGTDQKRAQSEISIAALR